jgi:hypothetical protein
MSHKCDSGLTLVKLAWVSPHADTSKEKVTWWTCGLDLAIVGISLREHLSKLSKLDGLF